jgi:hypothetical protein
MTSRRPTTQLVCVLSSPGQPDRKVVAEAPQLIVPATSAKRQWQAGQVGVLLTEQLRNEFSADLSGRVLIFHAAARHIGQVSSGAVPVRRLGVRREGGGMKHARVQEARLR